MQTYDNQKGYKLLMTKSYRFEGGDLVTDMFYASRGFRMSYIAITALQARVFSYAGESHNKEHISFHHLLRHWEQTNEEPQSEASLLTPMLLRESDPALVFYPERWKDRHLRYF